MQECVYWYTGIFYIYTIIICNFQLPQFSEFFDDNLTVEAPCGCMGYKATVTALDCTPRPAPGAVLDPAGGLQSTDSLCLPQSSNTAYATVVYIFQSVTQSFAMAPLHPTFRAPNNKIS